ncbi:MAG TPA: DNA/RNA helicase domain-containing protein [Kribbellaceae bacterium]|nr:DNA/RNA helicase domain-containing protein [Kribbellaceae bacterium]
MAAGYCWPWSDPRRDGTLVADVLLGSWARPWNLKGDRSVGGALWASDPAGFDQVGCVYTAQSFEYDWSGVIPGPDLEFRDLRDEAAADERIRNVTSERLRDAKPEDWIPLEDLGWDLDAEGPPENTGSHG